jgi:hypothetical protein
MTDHDDRLRHAFQALAGEDQAAAPRFGVPQRPARGRWPVTRVASAAVAVLAVAGATGAILRAVQDDPPFPIDLAAVTWRGPTDFLLNTPGASLLRELPRIGGTQPAPANPGSTTDTMERNDS